MGGALLLSVKRGADKRESNGSEEERKKEEDTETLVSPLHARGRAPWAPPRCLPLCG
jgi:hypothetical protein